MRDSGHINTLSFRMNPALWFIRATLLTLEFTFGGMMG